MASPSYRELTIETVAWALEAFLRSKSSACRSQYTRSLHRFADWTKSAGPPEAICSLLQSGAAEAHQTIHRWRDERLTYQTTRYIIAIQSFISYARKDGLVGWQLHVQHIVPDEDDRAGVLRRKNSVLTIEEIGRLRATIEKDSRAVGYRDRVILALLCEVMLSGDEISRLQLGDIDLGRNRLRIGRGSNGKVVDLPLSPPVVKDIEAWLQIRRTGPGNYLVVSCRRGKLVTGKRESAIARAISRRFAEAGIGHPRYIRQLTRAGILQMAQMCGENGTPVSVGMALARTTSTRLFVRYVDRAKEALKAKVAAQLSKRFRAKAPTVRAVM